MDRDHFVIGLGACVTSVVLFALSFRYRELAGGPGDPGTMFIPRLVLTLIFIVGAWSCIYAFIGSKAETAPLEEEDQTDDVMPGISLKSLGAIVATAIYLFAFQMELYFWATPIYLAVVLWLAGIRDWKTIVLLPLVFTLIAYFGFYRLLGLPLLTI